MKEFCYLNSDFDTKFGLVKDGKLIDDISFELIPSGNSFSVELFSSNRELKIDEFGKEFPVGEIGFLLISSRRVRSTIELLFSNRTKLGDRSAEENSSTTKKRP